MDNYYKILEVDKDASQEIIEKAYKTLVKRYHPDIQTDLDKEKAEEKIKKVNEAYDVLSDTTKREIYDKELNDNLISSDKYNEIITENIRLKNELNILKNQINNYQYYNNGNLNNNYYTQKNTNTNYTYNKNNYNVNPNNYYYNYNNINKNNFSFKNLFKFLFSLCMTGLIIFLIFHIPYIFYLFSFLFDSNFSILFIIILFILFYISKNH